MVASKPDDKSVMTYVAVMLDKIDEWMKVKREKEEEEEEGRGR